MWLGANVLPQPGQTRAQGRFRPPCVSSVAAQFGHTIRRFSSIARVLDKHIFEPSLPRAVRASASGAGIEVIDWDLPRLCVSLEGLEVRSLRQVAEQAKRIGRQEAWSIAARVSASEKGLASAPANVCSAVGEDRMRRLGSPDSNRDLTAPKAGGLPITPLPTDGKARGRPTSTLSHAERRQASSRADR